jgi:hypothetical protein
MHCPPVSLIAFPRWQGLSAPAVAFLVASTVVAVLLAPELVFGLDLGRSFEPLLWVTAATAVVGFLWVVARARWHWATKTLALLGIAICALGLLLRMLVMSMSADGPALGLGNGCSVRVLHVGAFGDSGDTVEKSCVVAALWMRRTALTHFDRESVMDLKPLPSKTPDTLLVEMTVMAYPKQRTAVMLRVPAEP